MRRVLLTALAAFCLAASAQDSAPMPQGPAYQYEGKWMARVQTPTGTLIETAATCVNPITLVAEDAGTLRRSDGARIRITPVDGSTLTWEEEGRVSKVIPENHGSFMALATYDASGRADYGRVIFYMRCGTAGATAAQQVCIAE